MEHTRGARVAALFVHPIKSAAAIPIDEMTLDDLGAVGDRRWLVIDDAGNQVTARETPALALVRQRFADVVDPEARPRRNVDGPLWLEAADSAGIRVELPTTAATRVVRVWDDAVMAHDAGDAVAKWMSRVLATSCRVVRLAESARRPLAVKHAGPIPRDGRRVAFTDGAPLLLLGQASVDALSDRLVEQGGEPMVVARFRPNIVLAHTTPHEEDMWRSIAIGAVRFGIGAPCSRCVITTIDPTTGERGVEPLRTLATYRRQDGDVMFGMNITHAAPGMVRVGDLVSNIEWVVR